MARIAYGVMGDTSGHVTRALAVAQEMGRHDFLFLGGGKVLDLRSAGYPVVELPLLSTLYRNHRVHVGATVFNGLKALTGVRETVGRATRSLENFDPELVLTDYEFFSSMAARRLGILCISVDNNHSLTKCRCSLPKGQTGSRLLFALPLETLYSNAHRYFITSFFNLPPKDPTTTEVFLPVLRQSLKGLTPWDGDHMLVYQTSSTFTRLLPVLEKMKRRCFIYGFGKLSSSGGLVFRGHSEAGFLEDLASCRYVVTNGGHGVIAEALHLGKPVLAFPIHLAYEQFFNAHMLASLQYGDYSLDACPSLNLFLRFEERLPEFKAAISQACFLGNEKLALRLDQIIAQSSGTLVGSSSVP